MKSIQITIHPTLLVHIILTGGAVGFTPSTTQSIRPFQTTALNEVTNDNAERQLRVIDLPTELAAFEYVNDHDYAAYDIFEDADRYDIIFFIFVSHTISYVHILVNLNSHLASLKFSFAIMHCIKKRNCINGNVGK